MPPASTPSSGSKAHVDPYDAVDAVYGYEVLDPTFGLEPIAKTSPPAPDPATERGGAEPAPATERGGAAPGAATERGGAAPALDPSTPYAEDGLFGTGRVPGADGAPGAGGVAGVGGVAGEGTPRGAAAFAEGAAGIARRGETSDGVPPIPRPYLAPGQSYDDLPAVPAPHRGEQPDTDHEFFGAEDHPETWGVVAPTGPPPQPGKPSGGNLKLPDWMRGEGATSDAASGGPAGDLGYGHYDDYGGYGEDEEHRSRRPWLIAGVVLALGLAAAAGVYVITGQGGGAKPGGHRPTRGPVAGSHSVKAGVSLPDKALPAFKGTHTKAAGRVLDRRAGLSYPKLAKPWQPQPKTGPMGELGFSAGQFAVTEKAGGQPKVWGRLMSAPLDDDQGTLYQGPGTERSATGQVADAFEGRMYGFKHHKKVLASQPLQVDGHKGWLVAYYLTYHRAGVKATGDLFVVALVDTGKKTPGLLLMSLPNTDRNLWPDVDFVVHGAKVG